MPIPALAAIIPALIAGGTLVPHAAGGFIVTGASGYIAGTYLSTAAVASLIGSAAVTGAGGLAALVAGSASAIIGSAGLLGTGIGASGLTGVLVSLGLVSTTPVWVPAAAVGAIAAGAGGIGYGLYRSYRSTKPSSDSDEQPFDMSLSDSDRGVLQEILRKSKNTPKGEEAMFEDAQAIVVQKLIIMEVIYRSQRNGPPKIEHKPNDED